MHEALDARHVVSLSLRRWRSDQRLSLNGFGAPREGKQQTLLINTTDLSYVKWIFAFFGTLLCGFVV